MCSELNIDKTTTTDKNRRKPLPSLNIPMHMRIPGKGCLILDLLSFRDSRRLSSSRVHPNSHGIDQMGLRKITLWRGEMISYTTINLHKR